MKRQPIAVTVTVALTASLLLGLGGCQNPPLTPAETKAPDISSPETDSQKSSEDETTPKSEIVPESRNTQKNLPLKITKQPESVCASPGSEVAFSVEATGAEPLKYYWQYQSPDSPSWSPSTENGARTPVCTLTMTDDLDNYQFRCMIRAENGDTVYSLPVYLLSTYLLPINESTFPDPAFRRSIRSFQDIDRDGSLSPYELKATSITLSDSSIRDLTGIEYFENLKTLTCKGIGLTKLDVSGLSKLEKLDCSENELTKLDLSANKALQELTCSGNPLKDLDVKELTKLEFLICSECSLTELDLSENAGLILLNCSGNPLDHLDVSSLALLDNLTCSDNGLTSLDLSHNPKLIGLDCSSNHLSELNVDSCPVLSVLDCYENPLTELDVQKCQKLFSIATDPDVTISGAVNSPNWIIHRPLTPDEYDEASGILKLEDGIYFWRSAENTSTGFIENGLLILKGPFRLDHSYPDENDVYENTMILHCNTENAVLPIAEDANFSLASGTVYMEDISTAEVNRSFKYIWMNDRAGVTIEIHDGTIDMIHIYE